MSVRELPLILIDSHLIDSHLGASSAVLASACGRHRGLNRREASLASSRALLAQKCKHAMRCEIDTSASYASVFRGKRTRAQARCVPRMACFLRRSQGADPGGPGYIHPHPE